MANNIKTFISNPFYLLLTTVALNCMIMLAYLQYSNVLSPSSSYTTETADREESSDSLLQGSIAFSTRMIAKKLYEQQCMLLDIKKTAGDHQMNTHATGGFCLTLDQQNKIQENYPIDVTLANAMVAQLFNSSKNVTLIDIGAGPGHYGARWLKEGTIKGYRALDAASGADILSNGLVEWTDFTEELQHYWNIRKSSNLNRDDSFYREYFWIDQNSRPRSDIELATSDWVLSLEVLEHVPPHKEKTVVDNLISLTDNGIILSWAVVGQIGLGHINERNNDYVLNLFVDQYGLNYCKNATSYLRTNSELSWFKNTLFVFAKKPLYNGFSCE